MGPARVSGGSRTYARAAAALTCIAALAGGPACRRRADAGADAGAEAGAGAGADGDAGAETDAGVPARVRSADGAVMLLVAAGNFLRGSPRGQGDPDEWPQRETALPAFWIDRTEVTTGQYLRCVDAAGCAAAATEEAMKHRIRGSCNGGYRNRDDRPINCVTRDEAAAFCRWAQARLPTEAEWEKAARGVDGRTFPWGDAPVSCDLAVWEDPRKGKACGRRFSWPVGSRPKGASPYGALDMAGNVWEWVSGDYRPAGDAPTLGDAGAAAADGPFGVVRGGGYGKDGPGKLRAAERMRFSRDNRVAGVGFRCAADGDR